MAENREPLEKELYFMIARFLKHSPCQEAFKVLTQELERKGLLPSSNGSTESQFVTYAEEENLHGYIRPSYLLEAVTYLLHVLEKMHPERRGLQTLFGIGIEALVNPQKEFITPALLGEVLYRNTGDVHSVHHITSSSLLVARHLCGLTNNNALIRGLNVFKHIHLMKRVLGHLEAVYCICYDRTGSVIITGSDDHLVKIWNSRNSQLVATLRGHLAEITELVVDDWNKVLASGSLDKTIRIWCLRTTALLTVLWGHTGGITSLRFGPTLSGLNCYLASTAADGTVLFWRWYPDSVTFCNEPVRFVEKSRPNTQILCSSFSPGGTMLVTGGTDHIIRVFQMTSDGPEKIADLVGHVDHVDTILFERRGFRFVSSSRDGTARIWFYKEDWNSHLLDVTKHINKAAAMEGERPAKIRIPMVGWSLLDDLIVTSTNEGSLTVWDSQSGTVNHDLKGHSDQVFVLEAHMSEPFLFLSAGHDGYIILWDIYHGEVIMKCLNSIEGQGSGAIYDGRFSPDGLGIATVDNHGHLLILGTGSSAPYDKMPAEQFFHTDQRPFVLDENGYILDEQTQTAPHLMPTPVLLNHAGEPHPAEVQLMLPGRNQTNLPRRRQRLGGDRELPPLLAEIEAAELEEEERVVNRAGPRQVGDAGGLLLATSRFIAEDVSNTDLQAWRSRLIAPALSENDIRFREQERHLAYGKEVTFGDRAFKKQSLVTVNLVEHLAKPKTHRPRPDLSIYQRPVVPVIEDDFVSDPEDDDYQETSPLDASSDSDFSIDEDDRSSSRPMRTRQTGSISSVNTSDHEPNIEASTSEGVLNHPAPLQSVVQRKSHNRTLKTYTPEMYRPPDWIVATKPHRSPYFPQLSDVICYFRQGHELYTQEVINQNMYNVKQDRLCYNLYNLGAEEVCLVRSISYSVGPPTVCCLKLSELDPVSLEPTGLDFLLQYHDVPAVVDFILLRQHVVASVKKPWKPGDRFRSVIDNAWWSGTVEERSDLSASFPGSDFLCYIVRWDTGDTERMSPWDMEPMLDEDVEYTGTLEVSEDDLKRLLYAPEPEDWGEETAEEAKQRICHGLETLMSMPVTQPFSLPVNIDQYPDYWRTVAYPVDLQSVHRRLMSGMYRRKRSLIWDIQMLEKNARKFNRPGSRIVKDSAQITRLCLAFISDPSLSDIELLMNAGDMEGQSAMEQEDIQLETPHESRSPPLPILSRSAKPSASSAIVEPRWVQQSRDLLELLVSREDSAPFREPVDTSVYTDYLDVVVEPMDLGTIRQRLDSGYYVDPEEFSVDVRTIFSNSRLYNTTPRSKIYSMTLRLSSLFDSHFEPLLRDWQHSRIGPGTRITRQKTLRCRHQPQSSTSEAPVQVQDQWTLRSHSRSTTLRSHNGPVYSSNTCENSAGIRLRLRSLPPVRYDLSPTAHQYATTSAAVRVDSSSSRLYRRSLRSSYRDHSVHTSDTESSSGSADSNSPNGVDSVKVMAAVHSEHSPSEDSHSNTSTATGEDPAGARSSDESFSCGTSNPPPRRSSRLRGDNRPLHRSTSHYGVTNRKRRRNSDREARAESSDENHSPYTSEEGCESSSLYRSRAGRPLRRCNYRSLLGS